MSLYQYFNTSILEPNKIDDINKTSLPNYLYLSLTVLWLYSGIVPLIFALEESLSMLAQLGIPQAHQMSVLMIASMLDIGFGLLILSRYRKTWLLWFAQLGVVFGYSAIIAIGLPENWTHPFAPLIKNIPIMAMLIFMTHRHYIFNTLGG